MNGVFLTSIIVVCGLGALFAWLARRARQAQRAGVRWVGGITAGLVATLCTGIVAAALLGVYRLNAPDAPPAAAVTLAGSAAQIDRGERLAHLCVDCHSTTGQLPLDGSRENYIVGMGTLAAPNLTPGGQLSAWSDGEIMRAIRGGVHRNGRSLLLMPSDQYRVMSDADVRALVAYLRAQPTVTQATPETRLNVLGAAVVGLGFFPRSAQPPITTTINTPTGVTAVHGEYLVTIAGCAACHGQDLQGGTSPFTPPGPNLVAIVGQWRPAEFVATMRSGVDPYGNALDPALMPWPSYAAAFTDEELEAIYTYINARR